MPIVEVTMVEGRSKKLKTSLIREITDAVERSISAPRQTIRVILREVPAEHFAVAGVAKSEERQRTKR
jgi:4-oxalocrotonate tautomerase